MSVLDDLSDLDRRVSESDSALDAFARSLVTSSLTGTSQGDQPALDPQHDTPAPPTPAPIHITTTASLSRLPAPELSGPRQLGTPATTAAEVTSLTGCKIELASWAVTLCTMLHSDSNRVLSLMTYVQPEEPLSTTAWADCRMNFGEHGMSSIRDLSHCSSEVIHV